MLGVDLSLLKIRDKIPRVCEARILGVKKVVSSLGAKTNPMRERKNFIFYLSKLKRRNFIFYLQLQKETQSGISTSRIREDKTKSEISTPRIKKIRITLTVRRFDYRTKGKFLIYQE